MSCTVQRISFSDLVSGSDGVRYTHLDSVPFMDVGDIIMVVCGKGCDDAKRIWRLLDETKKDELSSVWRTYHFQGCSQLQLVIPLQGAIKLIKWLPGDMDNGFRSQACDILTRFLGVTSHKRHSTLRTLGGK
jgi:hypothetical protein